MPIGRETAIAIAVVKKVPAKRGRMPKCFSAKRGVHCVSVRKSMMETSPKKERVSKRRTPMIPRVMKTDKRALKRSPPSMRLSLAF
ncbi:MAG: hypothetical protein MPW14_15550 [Candidatus Manganitrophus sp.]|nr:MAG: hypothetical protein MPW14_15550 [Candidatus Manganitrophus sp.]